MEEDEAPQTQHILPGCKAWIDYDAVTRSLLIYFGWQAGGEPCELGR